MVGDKNIQEVSEDKEKITDPVDHMFKKALSFFLITSTLVIIFLGSIRAKFPHESTFMLDVEKSLSVASASLNNSLSKLVDSLYGIGLNHPNLFYPFIVVIIYCLYLLYQDVNKYIHLSLERRKILEESSTFMKGGNVK